MSPAPRILLAADSGPGVGGGHVLRTIALAQALQARGADCAFALSPDGAAVFDRYGARCGALWPLPARADATSVAAAVRAAAAEVLVIDSYRADASWAEALGLERPRIVVIDDLADRRHVAELLVDPGYGRSPQDYRGLAPATCQVLTGPAYALLRDQFLPPAGAPRADRPVERAFLAFGLSDVEAVTAWAALRLRRLAPDLLIDVALAGDAASLATLRQAAASDPRLRLHVDAADVAAVMPSADVAVGAGGASTWERCALGLPSLVVIVADNQRRVVRALEADGVLLACDREREDFTAAFDAGWMRLQDAATRRSMAERSRALCDGRGAERVADAILAL